MRAQEHTAAASIATRRARPARPSPRTGALALQEAAGNQAMAGLLRPADVLTEARRAPLAPLPFRDEMERAFGQDLGGVDVHVGAAELVPLLHAGAATDGRTIAFASATPTREEVAHELTHVVQSRLGTPEGPISRPGDRAEAEARRVAPAAARGERVSVSSRPTGAVHGGFLDSLKGIGQSALGGLEHTALSGLGGLAGMGTSALGGLENMGMSALGQLGGMAGGALHGVMGQATGMAGGMMNQMAGMAGGLMGRAQGAAGGALGGLGGMLGGLF